MATLSDNYNRADSSTLGANWTLVYGEFTIVSNAVRQTFTGALIRSVLYTGGSLASNDYAVQCVTIIPTAANIAGGVCGRYSSTGNGQGYALIAGNGGAGLYRVSGGNIAALLASYPDASMTAGSTHTLRLECEGTTVRAYINGTLRATVTDSNYSSGGVGLATYNATTGATHLGMDDWTAYDLGGGGGTTYNQTFTGAITPAAAVLKRANSFWAGALSFVGNLTRQQVTLPSFVNFTSNSSTSATTAITLNKPTGAAAGDVLIWGLAIENVNPTVSPADAGVSLIFSGTPSGTSRAIRLLTYRKKLTSADDATTSWTFNVTTGYEYAAFCAAYRNVAVPAVSAISNTNSSVAGAVAPTVTTTGANAMVLHVAMNAAGSTWTPSASPAYTERADVRSSTATSNISITLAERLYTAAGATGAVTATASTADYWVAGHIVLEYQASGTQFTQTLTGALSLAGAIAKSADKGLAGALAPAGAKIALAARLFVGALTVAAALNKLTAFVKTGATVFSGTLATANAFLRTFSGALAPVGAFIATAAQKITLTGALALSGAVSRSAAKIYQGAVQPTGAALRRAAKNFLGTVQPTGAALRRVAKLLAGATAPAGALLRVKTAVQLLTGALTFASAATKRAAKLLAGSVTPAGATTVGALFSRLFSGALAPAGALSLLKALLLSVGGAIAPAGAAARRISKVSTGVLQPLGAALKQVAKRFTGVLTSAGSYAALKVLLRTFTGAVSFTGAVGKRAAKLLAGTLAPAGALLKRSALLLTGAVSFAGAAFKQLGKQLTGAVTFGGAVTFSGIFSKIFTGALAPAGALRRAATATFAGALAPVGAMFRGWAQPIAGALNFIGALTLKIFGANAIRLTVTQSNAAVNSVQLTTSAAAVILSNAAQTRVIVGDTIHE